MKVEAWIHFEKPGEKEKLKEIVESSSSNILATKAVQEEFGLSLIDSNTVIEMYNKRIRKQ